MTTAEVEALLRLLAEWEREEIILLMRERREAEREGPAALITRPRPCDGFFCCRKHRLRVKNIDRPSTNNKPDEVGGVWLIKEKNTAADSYLSRGPHYTPLVAT